VKLLLPLASLIVWTCGSLNLLEFNILLPCLIQLIAWMLLNYQQRPKIPLMIILNYKKTESVKTSKSVSGINSDGLTEKSKTSGLIQ